MDSLNGNLYYQSQLPSCKNKEPDLSSLSSIFLITDAFFQGTHELSVSLFQAIVLLLLNKTALLSFAQLKNQTKIKESELKRTLLSLTVGKDKILLKNFKGLEMKDEDKFKVNDKFVSKNFRLKINQVQIEETVSLTSPLSLISATQLTGISLSLSPESPERGS